jgi:peroxiredoxin Q/BCP
MCRLLSLLFSSLLGMACVSTAPSGTAVDAAGNERDPSQILAVGEVAPDFSVPDQNGETVKLADFKGKRNVVLIFYPANETPGCTRQLCAARDSFDKYLAAEAAVLGVNPADSASHLSFANNHSLPFPLLADTDGAMVRNYGSRGMGGVTTRTVYVIGKDGKIIFAERGMPETDKILAAISS